VDKTVFFHNIKRLPHFELAGQALYRGCTKVGQKKPCLQELAFCTSHPVDIQPVFHRRGRFWADFCLPRRVFDQILTTKRFCSVETLA
jgi:hypothetical protein